MATFRPIFRRGDTFVVAKPIRLTTAKILQPGTVLSKDDFGVHRLMYWYRIGRIAKKDCDWANAKIEAWKAKNPVVEEKKKRGRPKKSTAK